MKIVIIDYGLGNTKSIFNACKTITDKVIVSKKKKDIENASHLIFPGVGSFDYGMKMLKDTNFSHLIVSHFNKNKPILGICLGLQIFFEKSEEGKIPGLGLIKGNVIKIKGNLNSKEKIPVIGWREVKMKELQKNKTQLKTFYFDHSYMVIPKDEKIIEGFYCIDDEKINSFVKLNNFMGSQFHPEKSGKNGLNIIKKFLNL
jgi:glutamine amidotransferase